MNRSTRVLSLLFFVGLAALQLQAQVQTGAPPFGSFGGGPDIINLGNLNAHWTIPVLQKPGRGMDFIYNLRYDSSVWYPVTSGGTTSWQPVVNWGWSGQTDTALGFVSYSITSVRYKSGNYYCTDWTYSNFIYHDELGVSHPFAGVATSESGNQNYCGAPPDPLYAIATDGSGLALNASGVGTSVTSYVTSPSGKVSRVPSLAGYGAATRTDRNGNQITVDGSGNFYDTLSATTPVLTATGSGTASSPVVLTYTAPSGAHASYHINYANYTVATYFAAPQIGEYKSSAAVPLVTSIVLPDNSQYSFTYEPTPGSCTPYTGTTCVTARVKVITLPTGGTITYTYTGGNNGILPDGSTATLTRVTPDGTWTYAQVKGTGAASTTTVTDPLGNQTAIQFQGIYETQRKAYQGAVGGTLLQTTNTCYTTAAPPCTTTAVALPITLRTVTATIPGSSNLQSQHTDKFDTYGNVTESDDYDFATAAPFPLLKQTLITYAGLGGYLNAFQQTVIVKDGNGTIKSRQDTNYDQYSSFTGANCITGAPQHDDTGHGCNFTSRANATSVTTYTDPVTPGGAITKNFTYDSLGNLRSAQLNCCQNKTWAYSATTDYAYPDSVTSGTTSPTLTTSYTYDLNMGLLLTSTDPNSLRTTLTYDNLGRTLSSQVGSLPAANYTYTDSGTWSVKVCSPIQGTNTACQKSILDSQGRTVTSQLLDGGGTLYSATDTLYDSLGRAYKVSNPYSGSPAYWTQTYFDALGRAYQTTLPDNSSSTLTYADNTATTTDPTGKQRKAAADGLGRLTSVYEPDPSNNNSLTLQTSYAYNVFGELTQVTQGAQTRSYVYDALGRVLSSTTPEGGRTCFGSVTGSTCNADGYDYFNNLLKRTDARGVLTSYGYDTLNRLSSVSYTIVAGVPATPTVSLTYGLDSSCNAAHGAGCIGQIITMTDGPGSENYTYNTLEQLTQLQKVISGTTYNTSYLYNLAGELTQITYPSLRVVQQSVDNVGRLCEIAPSTTACGSASSPYATGYGYNAAGQVTGFKYGNGIFASLGFSADRLQLNCLDYSTTNRNGTCIHDSTTKFGLGYSYGTAGSNNGLIASITDSVDSGRNTTYSYDSLYRLSTAVTTGSASYPAWGLQENYDRYGNRLSQGVLSGCVLPMTCPQPSVVVDTTTNRVTGSPYAYDANGNVTNDGLNTLVYDAENHATSSGGLPGFGAYTYDGNGLRVKKCVPNCTSPTTTTVYIFSGSKVIAEYDNNAAPTAPSREYVYGGSALLAKIASSTTTYYHQDHVSNRLVTSSTGSTVTQMGHFPFGESWYNATNDKLYFTTYERDAESGNDYAQARSYISRLARFGSPDPLNGDVTDPQSLNRYAYVLNDPCNLRDPLGLTPTPCNFNIGVNGNGLLSAGQLKSLQAALRAIFQTAGVGVNFSFSGSPDYSLSIIPSSLTVSWNLGGGGPPTAIQPTNPQLLNAFGYDDPAGTNGFVNHGYAYFDRPIGFYGLSSSASLVGTVLGRVGAHEAGHYLLNMIHNPSSMSGMGGIMDAHPDALNPNLGFTGGQSIQLQNRCSQLHPPKPTPPVKKTGDNGSENGIDLGNLTGTLGSLGDFLSWLDSIPVGGSSTVTIIDVRPMDDDE